MASREFLRCYQHALWCRIAGQRIGRQRLRAQDFRPDVIGEVMIQMPFRNLPLRHLPSDVQEAIQPALARVALTPGMLVAGPRAPILDVYFVESGMLSVIADGDVGQTVEVALIGHEGLAGVSLALGCSDSPFQVSVQSAGEAFRMPARRFVKACQLSPSLHNLVLRYANVLMTQMAETARSASRDTLDARLARWLLMMHDRTEGDDILVTHDTIAARLGVRRPGVTVAIHILEGNHILKALRGKLTILDRAGLKKAAKGSYGLPEAELDRLLRSADSFDRAI